MSFSTLYGARLLANDCHIIQDVVIMLDFEFHITTQVASSFKTFRNIRFLYFLDGWVITLVSQTRGPSSKPKIKHIKKCFVVFYNKWKNHEYERLLKFWNSPNWRIE